MAHESFKSTAFTTVVGQAVAALVVARVRGEACSEEVALIMGTVWPLRLML